MHHPRALFILLINSRFKTALANFGVMWKAIAHSTQNHLLYLLCKISRLGNYHNLCHKQFSKATQHGKLLLWARCLWLFCTFLHITQVILDIWKKYKQITGNLNILFLISWKSCLFSIVLYINNLLIPHKNVTDSELTKVVSHFECPLKLFLV